MWRLLHTNTLLVSKNSAQLWSCLPEIESDSTEKGLLLSGSVIKNLPANAGDTGLISGSGWSTGEGNGYPLQYSCLENSMARGARKATVHGIAKSQTRLGTHTHTHAHAHIAPHPTRSSASSDISRRSRLLPLLLDMNQRFPQPSFQVQSTC